MNESLAIAIWLALLVLAVPYVRRAKHPDVKPLAAYMMFLILFSVVSSVLLLALSWLAMGTGLAPAVARPLGALVFLALVFVPGFLAGRWLIRRPPIQRPPPK